MSSPLRWGIIGWGRFAEIHARAMSALVDVRLVAACARTPARLESAAALGVEVLTTDYRELLARQDIDVVSVITHVEQHFAIARDALASGKHVFLEKPMAATADQCRELVAAAGAADGLFMVGHICRFDPRYALARQAISQGRVGRIVSMHATRNLRRAPGALRLDKISPLMGDGIHDADLMLWFTGAVPRQTLGRYVRVDDFRYPDIGWAMLEFGSPEAGDHAVGVIETIWRLPENAPTTIDARFEIIGTEGAIYIDCAHAGLAINDRRGWQYPDTMYWPQAGEASTSALAGELAYFARSVRRGERPDIVTPQEAAQAVMVIEAAEQSAQAGSGPVDVPRV